MLACSFEAKDRKTVANELNCQRTMWRPSVSRTKCVANQVCRESGRMMWRTIRGEHCPMRFVGLALISALAASGAAWGCQNAQPPSPGTSEAPSTPASPTEPLAAGIEKAPAALPGAASAGETTPRVTRVAVQGRDPSSRDPSSRDQDRLLAAGDPPLTGERLLRDPLIGDTLIGDGEPMDDVDDAASGVAEPDPGLPKPDPDQAGAPIEPPSFPRPALQPSEGSSRVSPEGSPGPGAGQAEPRGTALENQQR
jgi:hypothetical protein